jgi:hypothetical protein
MLAISRPQLGTVRGRAGRDQRIGDFDSMGPPELAKIGARLTACLFIDRNACQRPEKMIQPRRTPLCARLPRYRSRTASRTSSETVVFRLRARACRAFQRWSSRYNCARLTMYMIHRAGFSPRSIGGAHRDRRRGPRRHVRRRSRHSCRLLCSEAALSGRARWRRPSPPATPRVPPSPAAAQKCSRSRVRSGSAPGLPDRPPPSAAAGARTHLRRDQ